MRLAASARGLGLAEFGDRRRRVATGIEQLRALIGDRVSDAGNAHTALAARELTAYFADSLRDFSVPLDYPGSDFQRRAWTALLDIPFGQTRSYGEQAAALGDPGAARATGAANGQNRLAIIIPCHRVIGASGKTDRLRRRPGSQTLATRARGAGRGGGLCAGLNGVGNTACLLPCRRPSRTAKSPGSAVRWIAVTESGSFGCRSV